MRITWFGHAAFLIESDGLRIILDPFKSPDCGSYAPINEPADILCISHHNEKYHSCIAQVTGSPVLLDALQFAGGTRTVRGVTFRAVEVFENAKTEGPNAMVTFELEGLRITHTGDCGHPLNAEQMAGIENTDILLALAGGPPTIGLDDLKKLIDELDPRLTIPMHFKNEKINLKIRPVEDFLSLFPSDRVLRLDSSTLAVTHESILELPPIIVLQPAR